jgi:hypothetical protein
MGISELGDKAERLATLQVSPGEYRSYGEKATENENRWRQEDAWNSGGGIT